MPRVALRAQNPAVSNDIASESEYKDHNIEGFTYLISWKRTNCCDLALVCLIQGHLPTLLLVTMKIY